VASSALPAIRRGQIWLVDWSPGRGSEQLGRRPALIVQNDAGNSSTNYPNTVVAAISTKGKAVPVHVAVRKSQRNGLRDDSFVKCEQITTISKSRLLSKPWGMLDAVEMARVDQALKLSLQLK
jgi:mRNA interferase MazF